AKIDKLKAEHPPETVSPDPDQHIAPSEQHEPDLILDPANPLNSADAFLRRTYESTDGRLLHHVDGTFYAFREACYHEEPNDSLRSKVYGFLERAHKEVKSKTGSPQFIPFKPTKTSVDVIIDAVRGRTYASATPPAWLMGAASLPPPEDLIVARNGI